jgi:hypothetical protein
MNGHESEVGGKRREEESKGAGSWNCMSRTRFAGGVVPKSPLPTLSDEQYQVPEDDNSREADEEEVLLKKADCLRILCRHRRAVARLTG